MSKRSDIIDPTEWTAGRKYGLVYSEVLGWIDLGHAQGDDIKALLSDFRQGEMSSEATYQITYNQKMTIKKQFGTGKYTRWQIKKGLSIPQIHSIALMIMMSTAGSFEAWQSRWFFNWYTDSGFSGEDLTSDLLGFYRAILPVHYQSQLKLINKEAALKRWDYYGPVGQHKNKGFLPLLFPDPENECVIHQPHTGKLPAFMTWVEPWKDFNSGVVQLIVQDGTSFLFTPGI